MKSTERQPGLQRMIAALALLAAAFAVGCAQNPFAGPVDDLGLLPYGYSTQTAGTALPAQGAGLFDDGANYSPSMPFYGAAGGMHGAYHPPVYYPPPPAEVVPHEPPETSEPDDNPRTPRLGEDGDIAPADPSRRSATSYSSRSRTSSPLTGMSRSGSGRLPIRSVSTSLPAPRPSSSGVNNVIR